MGSNNALERLEDLVIGQPLQQMSRASAQASEISTAAACLLLCSEKLYQHANFPPGEFVEWVPRGWQENQPHGILELASRFLSSTD